MEETGFWQTVREDMRIAKVPVGSASRARLVLRFLYALVYFPSFACVFYFRVNHWLWKRNLPPWKLMNVWRYYTFKNDISCKATIAPGFHLVHTTDIVIPGAAVIGRNCTILNGVTLGSRNLLDKRSPKIGNDVYIGTGAKLLGGIEIGDGSVIGALTLCNRSVPPKSLAAGYPMVIAPLS